ncbi:MAG: hypothetical protein AAGF20_07525 [Pseudomonadota bacterium]
MRRAARVDRNQAEIVKALRQVGATVTPTHTVGGGFPDIVVGYQGATYALEIKDGTKLPSAQKLTEDEQRWHDTWRGQKDVVRDIPEALEAIGALRGAVS